MTKIDDGGPAFPVSIQTGTTRFNEGMTLRQHYAGLAMQGICASGPTKDWTDKDISREAVGLADALIAAMKEGN